MLNETSVGEVDKFIDMQNIQNNKTSVADNVTVEKNELSLKAQPENEQDKLKSKAAEEAIVAESLNRILESKDKLNVMHNRDLAFEMNQDSEDLIVKVIDKETNDVIRQIPSEEFLRVAEKIQDLSDKLSSAQGLLFDSKI